MEEKEIADESIISYMTAFAGWAATTPIPHYFDDNLQPTRDNENECCATGTLINYLGQFLQTIREKFPHHVEWRNIGKSESPEWWTDIRGAFKRESTRYQMFESGDAVFGGEETRPLYRDLGIEGGKKDDPHSQCDLSYVLTNLFNSAKPGNNNLETSLQILMTYDSIGRGGEVKFQDYVDWTYDYLLSVTDTMWAESKRLNHYSMARIPDENPLFDWYFVFGAFVMCENGLYRSEQHIKDNLLNKVFPSLYYIQNTTVTTKITTVVRNNLPPGLTEEQRNQFSAKSLRQAAITQMSMHPNINIFSSNARTGHSTGTNNDSYLDKKNPARGLPAAHALHGRKDLYTKVIVPRMTAEVLGKAGAKKGLDLINSLFPAVNIPDFQKGGRLWVVLERSAASLVRHYSTALTIGNNRVCDMMAKAARSANINDDAFPDLSPELVLLEWSKKVASDYDSRLKIACVESMGATDPAGLTMNSMVASIASDVNELKEEKRLLISELASHKATISRQNEVINALEMENQKLSRRLSIFKSAATNAALDSPIENRSSVPAAEDANLAPLSLETEMEAVAATAPEQASISVSALLASDMGAQSAPLPMPLSSTTLAVKKNKRAKKIEYGFDARMVAEEKGNKGVNVSDLLVQLADLGKIAPSNLSLLGKDDLPHEFQRNRQLAMNCLEMIEFALKGKSRSDVDILSNARACAERVTILQAAGRLEDACVDMLAECENSTAALNKQKKKTFLALGTRIKDYKNDVHKHMNAAKKACDEPLVTYEKLREVKEGKKPPIHSCFDNFPRKKRKRDSDAAG